MTTNNNLDALPQDHRPGGPPGDRRTPDNEHDTLREGYHRPARQKRERQERPQPEHPPTGMGRFQDEARLQGCESRDQACRGPPRRHITDLQPVWRKRPQVTGIPIRVPMHELRIQHKRRSECGDQHRRPGTPLSSEKIRKNPRKHPAGPPGFRPRLRVENWKSSPQSEPAVAHLKAQNRELLRSNAIFSIMNVESERERASRDNIYQIMIDNF